MTTGNTHRFTAEFTDWDGNLADVNDIFFRIYDREREVVEETDVVTRESVGVYYVDYTIPEEYDGPLAFYFEGLLGGTPISRRAYVDRAWAEYDVRAHLLRWVKDHCRDDFMVDGKEVLPGGVELFLEQATIFYTEAAKAIVAGAKTSESLGDYSVSFGAALQTALAQQDLPGHLRKLLVTYKRVKML